jgi:hypothetical protein
MAEPTARIDAAHSFREPEGNSISGRAKEKSRPRPKPARQSAAPEVVEDATDADDSEQHQLDTLA